METWLIILISLSISAILSHFLRPKKPLLRLPPGPPSIPIIGTFLWLLKSPFQLQHSLRNLRPKFGPILTLHIASRPFIFVFDRALAHRALIQNGAACADRPPAPPTRKVLTSNQHNINSASYGPTWRVLRRNLTAEILHPSHVKSYSRARSRVMNTLKERIQSQSKSGEPVSVKEDFQYAMFSLLALMCFGEEVVDESRIGEIKEGQQRMILNINRFNVLNFWPRVTKILLRRLWKEFLELRKAQEDVLIPLIRAKKKANQDIINKINSEDDAGYKRPLSYVDTLLSLELPDEKRMLNESEMVTLCSEFITAGSDTTSTALQCIMANLVKYPNIQQQLFMEIKRVVRNGKEEVKEDDLQKMPYLKAVVLEGLRRHPPGHFVVPHAVTEDMVLGNYVVPKNGVINFMVADMGWDPEVWEDPMAFKPERFLNINGGAVFDITGSREIKMMPFGVGRRICPGYGLAMLHLEYFVANLIWKYEWKAVDGVGVDFTEKEELTVVMKYPLQAHVSSRFL